MPDAKKRYKHKITRQIAKAMEDPEFRKAVREFVRHHSGKSS